MDKLLAEAFSTIEAKLSEYKKRLEDADHEVGLLENKQKSLIGEVGDLERDILSLKKERGDLQYLLDAKSKEDEIKTIALKQAIDQVKKREDVATQREKNLDLREIRIKDREVLYGNK